VTALTDHSMQSSRHIVSYGKLFKSRCAAAQIVLYRQNNFVCDRRPNGHVTNTIRYDRGD